MLRLKKNILNIKNPNTGKFESVPVMVGESAYQVAVRNGYEGTEEEWLSELAGVEIRELINKIVSEKLEDGVGSGSGGSVSGYMPTYDASTETLIFSKG